ncbi:MAG: hypothetical protein Q9167_001770 [Letrouitia subvulpina]
MAPFKIARSNSVFRGQNEKHEIDWELAAETQMSFLESIFAGEDELGKKNDDRRPNRNSGASSTWLARKPPALPRKRRLVYGLLACFALFLFFKNIPPPDPFASQPTRSRPVYGSQTDQKTKPKTRGIPESTQEAPPRPDVPSDAEIHYYEGPIKFFKLAASLHAISRLQTWSDMDNNVLFAASSLKSAAEIIPLACEMAGVERNVVHMALMGRDDLAIDEIKSLNGADSECNVQWHDARPNFSWFSTDFRMEVSVSSGLGYIKTYMHPQVIITDDPDREDAFFTKAIRAKASEISISIIELPSDGVENMRWITRLSSSSLAAWQKVYVDILIHAPSQSSGSFLRLLKSIEAADYFNFRRPHLTIELPTEIDEPTRRYIQELVWPPLDGSGTPHTSQVSLRHRIPHRSATPGEASTRLVESFYPARPADSHVLLLSPQTELSPLYFHYLMYHLLEYKYSSSDDQVTDARRLMGISLDLPSVHLNGTEPFVPPALFRMSKESKTKVEKPTPFMWQAPNSNAALYFGDKWIEFHSFLTSRVAIKIPEYLRRPKQLSADHPSWMEYLLELMRSRGYPLLYPVFSSEDDSIATVHNELSQLPEEYATSEEDKEEETSTSRSPPPLDPSEAFTIDPNAHPLTPKPQLEKPPSLNRNLLSFLPDSDSPLPFLFNLPLLSHLGLDLTRFQSENNARAFASDFRQQIGRCTPGAKVQVVSMRADDLFCQGDEEREIGEEEQVYIPPPGPMYPMWVDPPQMKDDGHVDRRKEFAAHLRRQAQQAGMRVEEEEEEKEYKTNMKDKKSDKKKEGEGRKEGKEKKEKKAKGEEENEEEEMKETKTDANGSAGEVGPLTKEETADRDEEERKKKKKTPEQRESRSKANDDNEVEEEEEEEEEEVAEEDGDSKEKTKGQSAPKEEKDKKNKAPGDREEANDDDDKAKNGETPPKDKKKGKEEKKEPDRAEKARGW